MFVNFWLRCDSMLHFGPNLGEVRSAPPRLPVAERQLEVCEGILQVQLLSKLLESEYSVQKYRVTTLALRTFR